MVACRHHGVTQTLLLFVSGNHNLCRNPNGSMQAPWCYTDKAFKYKELCDVPICGKYHHGPGREKICLQGFRQSKTQTSPFSYKDKLEN